MEAYFTIDLEPARALMRVSMGGFYTIGDVARYFGAIHDATHRLGCTPGEQVMINDISEMSIQSQDVVTEFARVMADPRYAARRVGFVVASTLARMQLQRVIGSRTAQIFATEQEAEAWLFAQDSAAAA